MSSGVCGQVVARKRRRQVAVDTGQFDKYLSTFIYVFRCIWIGGSLGKCWRQVSVESLISTCPRSTFTCLQVDADRWMAWRQVAVDSSTRTWLRLADHLDWSAPPVTTASILHPQCSALCDLTIECIFATLQWGARMWNGMKCGHCSKRVTLSHKQQVRERLESRREFLPHIVQEWRRKIFPPMKSFAASSIHFEESLTVSLLLDMERHEAGEDSAKSGTARLGFFKISLLVDYSAHAHGVHCEQEYLHNF